MDSSSNVIWLHTPKANLRRTLAGLKRILVWTMTSATILLPSCYDDLSHYYASTLSRFQLTLEIILLIGMIFLYLSYRVCNYIYIYIHTYIYIYIYIYIYTHTHTVQFSSVTQSCLTLCDPMDCSTPGSLSITNNSKSLLNSCPLSQ